MSFFGRLFGRKPTQQPEPVEAPAPAQAPEKPRQLGSDEIERLAMVGQPGGPDELTAARLLASALGGPRQRAAIEAIARAMSRGNVPERLRVLSAQALVSRGEGKKAIAFLHEASDATALMLKADLLHDGGQVAMAVSVIERVLARDIDMPGARERHARWRAGLAPHASRPRGGGDVTMAVPTIQQSPYRIVREVARGGAGTVYEAKDDALGRDLALKVYHQVSVDKPQIRREAQVAVRLAGPGVVRVFDVDIERGWIALEWTSTGSLREVLVRGDLAELGEPVSFLRKLAHALSRVHAEGWVHADVKPANVLMRTNAEPILSDFGIAVRNQEASLGGSAGFMSPERLAGAPLDPSDDVYGFGRIIEDTILKSRGTWNAFRPLAERCMVPRPARPTDGRSLLELLNDAP